LAHRTLIISGHLECHPHYREQVVLPCGSARSAWSAPGYSRICGFFQISIWSALLIWRLLISFFF